GVDRVAAAGEDLVRVGLVADVPDDAVVGRVVHRMQGDGQFDHAQARAEMAAGLADRLDQVGAQFVCDGGQLGLVEPAQVGRGFNARKARVARRVDHAVIFTFAVVTGKAKAAFGRGNACRCGEPDGGAPRLRGKPVACATGRLAAAASYLPRRRPNRPVDFTGSAGSGGVSATRSANPVARLALTKSATSATGMPLAAAISASVAGPFIIAVAMRKWRGYSRSVCGHLLSL